MKEQNDAQPVDGTKRSPLQGWGLSKEELNTPIKFVGETEVKFDPLNPVASAKNTAEDLFLLLNEWASYGAEKAWDIENEEALDTEWAEYAEVILLYAKAKRTEWELQHELEVVREDLKDAEDSYKIWKFAKEESVSVKVACRLVSMENRVNELQAAQA